MPHAYGSFVSLGRPFSPAGRGPAATPMAYARAIIELVTDHPHRVVGPGSPAPVRVVQAANTGPPRYDKAKGAVQRRNHVKVGSCRISASISMLSQHRVITRYTTSPQRRDACLMLPTNTTSDGIRVVARQSRRQRRCIP